jgi:hypothetical protein
MWCTNGNAGPKRGARYSLEDGVKKHRGCSREDGYSSGPIHPTERPREARFTVDPGLVPVLPRVVEGGGHPIERGILLCPRPTVQVEGMGARFSQRRLNSCR